MVKCKKGLYSRGSNPYLEMECQRKDDYLSHSAKAASKCAIPYRKEYKPILFKVNGTMILYEEITI